MKNLCLIILVVFFSFNAFAQKEQEVINQASEGFCSCANEVYGFIDEDVQNVFMKMTAIRSSDEQEAYVKSLDKDVLVRLKEQTTKMKDENVAKEFKKCLNGIKVEMSKIIEKGVESGRTEVEMKGMMLASVQKVKGCEFVAFLLTVGAEKEKLKREAMKSAEKESVKSSKDK